HRFHDDDVAIIDKGIDHGLTPDLQRIGAFGCIVSRDGHHLIVEADGFDRHTSGDAAPEGHHADITLAVHAGFEAQATRSVADALDKALLFQDAEVVVHVAGGTDAHATSDLAVRR